MAHVENIFPIPIYMNICPVDITSCIDYLNTAELAETSDEVISNYGYRSKDSYVLNNDECTPLRNWLVDCVDEYAKSILGLEVEGMGITQSWLSIKRTGQKHTAHAHPNSVISGVFYFKDGDTPIMFSNHDHDFFKITRNPDIAPWNNYTIYPKGMGVVLFPSHLEHEVIVNENEDRYSLSFNTMPLGPFGSEGDLTHVDYSRIIGRK